MTYDSIDVGEPLTWEWEPRVFEWRREALPSLAPVLGSHLRSIDLIEIGFEAASLGMYNGLDDTQEAVDLEAGAGWRKRRRLPA